MLAHGTDRLVAVGGRVRDELLEARIGEAGQYAVVPPGVTLGCIPTRGTARDALELDHNAVVIAIVGRWYRSNGWTVPSMLFELLQSETFMLLFCSRVMVSAEWI